MKGQTSVEYGIVLGLMLIVALIVLSMIYDFPSVVNKDDSAFWESREIAVLRVELYSNQTLVLLKNNMRYPIMINEINLSSYNLSVSPAVIAPENFSLFVANTTIISDQLLVRINYSIGNETRIFTPEIYYKAKRK